MMTGFVVALAAGGASALMFASLLSGSLISIVLAYFAPLPLLVAALSWGPVTTAIGGIGATLAIGAVLGLTNMLIYAVWAALPACWLGYLILLGRPSVAGAATAADVQAAIPIEWYPIGRVLLWIAIVGGLITSIWIGSLGLDADAIKGALRSALTPMIDERASRPALDMLVTAAPSATAFVSTLLLAFNVLLAARIARTSKQLRRPWPDLKRATLPPMILVALCVSIALGFAGGLVSIVGQIASAALMTVYALTGLATLHTITLALKSRGAWLCLAYATILFFVWPMLLMSLIGLADSLFGLRERYYQSHPAVPTS